MVDDSEICFVFGYMRELRNRIQHDLPEEGTVTTEKAVICMENPTTVSEFLSQCYQNGSISV